MSTYALSSHAVHALNVLMLSSHTPVPFLVALCALLLVVSAAHGQHMKRIFVKNWAHEHPGDI